MSARDGAVTIRDKDGRRLMERARFNWDEEPTATFTGWHRPDVRWNGFATPAFERDEADRLMRWQAEHVDELGDPDAVERITYDANLDAYVLAAPASAPDVELVEGFNARCVDGVTRHLYAIGAWAWTWSEVSE